MSRTMVIVTRQPVRADYVVHTPSSFKATLSLLGLYQGFPIAVASGNLADAPYGSPLPLSGRGRQRDPSR
jgi:hypothetical protein